MNYRSLLPQCIHFTLTDINVGMEEKLPIEVLPTYILILINISTKTMDLKVGFIGVS